MDFMLGSDYENIRPLDAKGGMGDLFRAHKKGLDVEVVIKRIKRKYIGRLDQQNEANILKGLKHQYLPRIYDVIPGEDGCLYTIMDYIPGVDLQQYVKQNGRVPQPLAHRWACQLCEVVAYLHAQTPPILHCDIKPHNIMITGQGDICLIDFNTSLVFQGDDTVVGVTKGYAAPEQYLAAPTGAVGQPAAPTVSPTAATVMAAPTEYAAPAPLSSAPSAAPSNPLVRRSSQPSFSAAVTASAGAYGPLSVRTDVYAIGATMYYMVTAATPERSLDPVTDVTAHRPAISRTMVSIIRRAMSKQQKNRFASADEMLRALQDVDKLDRPLPLFCGGAACHGGSAVRCLACQRRPDAVRRESAAGGAHQQLLGAGRRGPCPGRGRAVRRRGRDPACRRGHDAPPRRRVHRAGDGVLPPRRLPERR